MNFEELKSYLEYLSEVTNKIDAQIKVFKNGEEVFSYCVGFKDSAHNIPAEFGDCFNIFSLTKPITCAAAMQLVEKGMINLNDPVEKYLPYFKNATVSGPKGTNPISGKILVWHLFAMQSGFNYDIDHENFAEGVRTNANTADLMKITVENIPMSFEPATHWKYACRNHETLGCIIEAVTGLSFPEYLEKNIFSPLEMKHIGFSIKGHLKEHIADIFSTTDGGETFSKLDIADYRGYTPNYKSGAYGLICDIDSYAKFAIAMANNGIGKNGACILSRESIDLMRTDRLSEDIRNDFHQTPHGYGYGLGVRTLITKEKGSPTPLGEFGWDGAAGGYTLFDTENNIAIVFLTHTCGGNRNLDQIKIRNLAYKGIFSN